MARAAQRPCAFALLLPPLCIRPSILKQPADHSRVSSPQTSNAYLLYFWVPSTQPCKQMTEVVEELARKYPSLFLLHLEAETNPEFSESFDIESIPSFIVLRVCRPLPSIPLPSLPSCGWVPSLRPRLILPPPHSPGHRTTHLSHASWVQMPAPSPTPSIAKHVGLAGGSGGGATATLPLSQTNRASATGMTSETPRSSSGACIGS